MGRPERTLDSTSGPIAAFAHDLRGLRNRAGNPTYRELARTALFAPSVLSSAASGHRLPTLAVTLAFVAACGGDRATWERRWLKLAGPGGTAQPSSEQASVVPLRPAALRPAAIRPPVLAAQAGPAAEPSQSFPRAVPGLACPAQLPIGLSAFVGRRQTLASASRNIGQTGPPKIPLMISGPIGVGKTAFALRLADDVSAEFPDGQLYADLGAYGPGNQSSNGIVRGFLRALGVPAPLVPDDPMQRIGLYRSLLAQRRLLVLLENVRDEGQVRPLLGRAAHSQVVVTSRARLLGLEGVHHIDLDAFSRAESMALIGRLVGPERVRPEYAAADALAELCGDLPLAVNIVGRKIAARPEWAVTHAAGLLADRDRLLDRISVGDVNVRDRFTAAYLLLSPPGRQAVHHLGLSRAGWVTAKDLAPAMGISVDLADQLLEGLVDGGLLIRADAVGRYGVSTLVSAFAADAECDAAHAAVPLANWRSNRTVFASSRRSVGCAQRKHSGLT